MPECRTIQDDGYLLRTKANRVILEWNRLIAKSDRFKSKETEEDEL
jgi:hypothetical protein